MSVGIFSHRPQLLLTQLKGALQGLSFPQRPGHTPQFEVLVVTATLNTDLDPTPERRFASFSPNHHSCSRCESSFASVWVIGKKANLGTVRVLCPPPEFLQIVFSSSSLGFLSVDNVEELKHPLLN